MRSKFLTAICLVILLVIMLFTGATPVSAQSMDMAGAGSCHHSPGNDMASLPLCCITADCPLSHTITASLPPSPNQITLSKVIQLGRLNASPSGESSFDLNSPSRLDSPRQIPRPPGADYRCRNSLSSEEPPLV